MREWTILTEGEPPYTGRKVTIIQSRLRHTFLLVMSIGALVAPPAFLLVFPWVLPVIFGERSPMSADDLVNRTLLALRLLLREPLILSIMIPTVVGFVLVLGVIPRIARSLKIIILGEKLVFDGEQGILFKDNRAIAEFDEVERLEVTVFGNSEGPDSYRLSVRLQDKRKVVIARSTKLKSIRELAREIVSVTDFRIVQARSSFFDRF
jgi:hypothetical protein